MELQPAENKPDDDIDYGNGNGEYDNGGTVPWALYLVFK